MSRYLVKETTINIFHVGTVATVVFVLSGFFLYISRYMTEIPELLMGIGMYCLVGSWIFLILYWLLVPRVPLHWISVDADTITYEMKVGTFTVVTKSYPRSAIRTITAQALVTRDIRPLRWNVLSYYVSLEIQNNDSTSVTFELLPDVGKTAVDALSQVGYPVDQVAMQEAYADVLETWKDDTQENVQIVKTVVVVVAVLAAVIGFSILYGVIFLQ